MKLKLIVASIICMGFGTQSVVADDLSDLKEQLKIMQAQMQVMQSKLDAQESKINAQDSVLKVQKEETASIKHQQAVRVREQEAKGVKHQIADSITMGGVIDVIAKQTNNDSWSGDTASDLVLDTLELSFEASAGDWVNGSILFLYEDANDDNFLMDQAYITFANAEVTPFYATAGRFYVPFGNFKSNMISDPVTLTLAETRADAAQLGIAMDNGFYGSAYVFNGDAEEEKNNYTGTDRSKIDNYGLNLGFAMENDDFSLDLGAGYINNIANSSSLLEAMDDTGLCDGSGCTKDYVGGLSIYAIASYGQFSLIGEYIASLDDFESKELVKSELLPYVDNKIKPKAWNIEGAYNFELAGKEATLAIAYQKTEDMFFDTENTDFVGNAWLASISVGIIDNTTLSAEWKHGEAYDEVKDAKRDNDKDYDSNGDLVQVKVSYEF